MKNSGTKVESSFRIVKGRDGKLYVEKIPGWGLSSSAKIAKRKADKKPKLKRTR